MRKAEINLIPGDVLEAAGDGCFIHDRLFHDTGERQRNYVIDAGRRMLVLGTPMLHDREVYVEVLTLDSHIRGYVINPQFRCRKVLSAA